MPNNIRNSIIFDCSAEKLNEILVAIQYEKEYDIENYGIGTFDFNKVIPMPKSLHVEVGTSTDIGVNLYLTSVNPDVKHYGKDKLPYEKFDEIRAKRWINHYNTNLSTSQIDEITKDYDEEKMLATGETVVNNMLKYNAATWYDWRISHWDTKWNSYDFKSYTQGDSKISFSTAWSPPHAVIRELSKKFPDVTITHFWADEDIGRNCGEVIYKQGEIIHVYQPETWSKDAYDIAFGQWGCSPEDCGYTLSLNNKYISIENKEYELIELFGEPALFSNSRFTDDDTPRGMYHYDIRHSDDGDRFVAIEPSVRVNHAGSILIKKALDFGADDYIEFSDEASPNFIGITLSVKQFMDNNYEM